METGKYKNYLNEIRNLSILIKQKKTFKEPNEKYKLNNLILNKCKFIHKFSLELFDDKTVQWWQFAWSLLLAVDMDIDCGEAYYIMRRKKRKYKSFYMYCLG